MTRTRQAILALALGRAAFGVGLLGPPSWVATRWIGPDAERPATRVAVRGLAVRDLGFALGTIDALRRDAPAAPWLVAAVGGDVADIGVSLAAGDALPSQARWGTPVLAGVTALIGAALAAADER